MESFSLLKIWRAGGGPNTTAAAATTIATSVLGHSHETETDDDDDEGPFFDLEFAVRDEDEVGGSTDEEAATELSSDDATLSLSPSPSDELFFKGPSLAAAVAADAPPPPPPPQFPISLIKTATRLRVLMLRLRRPKPDPVADADSAAPKQQLSKLFIKFKIEEVPIVSLFTRDSSSRNASGGAAATSPPSETAAAAAEEKGFANEVVQRYISKIKPLYVRVSKRYGEKLRFSAAEAAAGGEAAVPAGLGLVRKRLGKSRSAPLAVTAAPAAEAVPQRRDDSLLQQQDGIQSAIAHCKRSFNATRGAGAELAPLARSMSDPGGDGTVRETTATEQRLE